MRELSNTQYCQVSRMSEHKERPVEDLGWFSSMCSHPLFKVKQEMLCSCGLLLSLSVQRKQVHSHNHKAVCPIELGCTYSPFSKLSNPHHLPHSYHHVCLEPTKQKSKSKRKHTMNFLLLLLQIIFFLYHCKK